jgi:hypothetical protein
MIGQILSYLQLCDFIALNEEATSSGGASLPINCILVHSYEYSRHTSSTTKNLLSRDEEFLILIRET